MKKGKILLFVFVLLITSCLLFQNGKAATWNSPALMNPVTFDGLRTENEWNDAFTQLFSFIYSETHAANISIKNDWEKIYFCVQVFNEDFHSWDKLSIQFDIGNDLTQGNGEVRVYIEGEKLIYAVIREIWDTSKGEWTTSGGTDDGKTGWNGIMGIGNYTFEFAIPFSWIGITSGSGIRFTLLYSDWDKLETAYYPSSVYANYNTLQTTFVETPFYVTYFWWSFALSFLICIPISIVGAFYGGRKLSNSNRSKKSYLGFCLFSWSMIIIGFLILFLVGIGPLFTAMSGNIFGEMSELQVLNLTWTFVISLAIILSFTAMGNIAWKKYKLKTDEETIHF